MKVLALFVVLLIAAVVFGAIGYFSYQLLVEPGKETERERVIAKIEAEPTPDPSLGDFAAAAALADDRTKLHEAIAALQQFVATHPNSTVLDEAKSVLGELNATVVFTTVESPDKEIYTVKSGDSLVRIASLTNSSAELILRSNNLPGIDLQIGQILSVPQLDIAVVVDRETSTLTVFNHNVFFKEYRLLSPVPGSSELDTAVKEKVAMRDGKRVIFGGADFPGSLRTIPLDQGGVSIRGGVAGDTGGIILSQHDIEEIFPLVTRGTRVIIR